MGNDTSTPIDQHTRQLLEEYDHLSNTQDKRLGEVRLFQHKLTRQLVALKELKAGSKEELAHF